MKVSLKYWRSSIALVVVVMALIGSTMAFAQNSNPGVLSPAPPPYGHTFREWSNLWWQWAFSIPADVNPVLDTTGANCGERQSGPVWFLAGTFGSSVTRECAIPAGKALFFPIANTQQDNICPVASFTVGKLQTLAANLINSVDVTTLTAQVDGVVIQILKSYRAGPGNTPYSVTLPQNNIYTVLGCPDTQAGTYYPAVSDGYYLMLAPLTKGSHTIHFTAPAPFNVDVTYNLTVN